MTTKFKTISVHVSGAICGNTWMPQCKAGIPFTANVKQQIGRFSKKGATFRDVLLLMLNENGGDFQNPSFTADTVLRVERRKVESPGRYTMHIKEREISELNDCADLVDSDSFVGDFLGEDY